MMILTDRFHGEQAHDSCPSSFKMSYWKSIVEAQKWLESHEINTSAAEQLNAKLCNLGKHLCCVKNYQMPLNGPRNFVKYTIWYKQVWFPKNIKNTLRLLCAILRTRHIFF